MPPEAYEPPDEAAWKALAAAAEEVRTHAYAPYSGFSVGAAVMTKDGRIFAGSNVENASYGLSICAERNAVFSAVAASEGRPTLRAAYITKPAVPCGACRQVLAEFGNPFVSYETKQGRRITRLSELLPGPFSLPPSTS